MGILNDDAVLIEPGKSSGDPSVATVNCPDESGLGSTLCRIILEFGLSITRADFSTDGRWCYIVFWVTPDHSSPKLDWDSLKNRLLSACPSCLGSFYFCLESNVSKPPSLYLLKFFCRDRKGLLHDVTKVLTELELTIQRVKVMTTPDGRVLDMFFITDAIFMPIDTGGETDLRFVYCAAAICDMLGNWSGMDKEKAKDYILNCQSYDGGFGLIPGSESHETSK
ncbi:unnamed protein product [Microthlaspi erraticum]|uniref:ACT domain-containing protein ACR n=1 Tax=Microthlaspi erraticum TaxID=1685480 RepID=A0A6D2IVE4_9BRAS|nr:unnamed protein product [Microthlaspi erraticum]